MPTEINDETLVAYLDGELTHDESETVNRSLAHDSTLRERLDKLRKTWDLLEDLPAIEPAPELAQTTIEMVTMAIVKEKKSWFSRLKGKRWLLLLAACLATFGGGAAVARARSMLQTRQLVSDLPIIVHYKQLAHIDSLEWLEKLANIENLLEAANHNPEAVQAVRLPAADSERIAFIRQLDPVTRSRIADNQPYFLQDSPQRKSELRAIADRIAETSELDYWAVLEAYAIIMERVGTSERTHLYAISDLDERAAEVSDLVRRELALGHAKELADFDKSAIRDWVWDLQDRLWDSLFSRLPDPDAQIVSELYRDASESFIISEDIDDLRQRLSPAARQLLVGLDDRQVRDVLGLWIYYVVEPSRASPIEPTPEELQQRFNNLSNDKKSELEFLSERDARNRLAQ